MQVTISKIAALFIALATIIVALIGGDLPFAGTIALGLILPLLLIWFPEEIGSWNRWARGMRMVPSPPGLVAGMGWVFLIGLSLLFFWLCQ